MKLYRTPNSFQKTHSEMTLRIIRNTYSPIVNSSPALHQPFRMPGRNSRRQKPPSSRSESPLAMPGTTEPYSVNMLYGRNEYTAKASSAVPIIALSGLLYLASFSVAWTSIAGASASTAKAMSLTRPSRNIFTHSTAVKPITVGGTNSRIILVMKPTAAEKAMNTGAKCLNQS